jgi:hypothetical protein
MAREAYVFVTKYTFFASARLVLQRDFVIFMVGGVSDLVIW